MPMCWQLRVLHCSRFRLDCPAPACWQTASTLHSEQWQFPKARLHGLPISPNLSKRPKPRAWCSEQSRAPTCAESRSHLLEIQARSSEPTYQRLGSLLIDDRTWHCYRGSGLVQLRFVRRIQNGSVEPFLPVVCHDSDCAILAVLIRVPAVV